MTRVGAATEIINGDIGAPIQGATVNKTASGVRDNMEANALYLERADTRVLLISCDLVAIPVAVNDACRARIGQAIGMPERSVILTATHMHSGPSVIPTCPGKPVDTSYLERLQEHLVTLARQAVDSATDASMAWGQGSAHLGYNRRCCWADGTHSMYGDITRDDFTGIEGPEDPTHSALFVRNADRELTAILQANTCHPTTFYGSDQYSADFPGASRQQLRELFGEIPILYLNGAFGDVAHPYMHALVDRKPGRIETLMRLAHQLTGETLRLLNESPWHEDAVIDHAFHDVPIPVRLPSPERLAWADAILERADAGEDVPVWDRLFGYGARLLQDRFGQDPTDVLPVHGIRIGDLAIVTEPCELFCRFGLDIRRRSPAGLTAICGVADGYRGYCPSMEGVIGGGYSGEPIHWTRLETTAGYRIVDQSARLLHHLWRSLGKTEVE